MAAIPRIESVELALFRHVVDQTPNVVIFGDVGGVIRVWNHGAEAVFGFSADEALGNNLEIIIAERFRRDLQQFSGHRDMRMLMRTHTSAPRGLP